MQLSLKTSGFFLVGFGCALFGMGCQSQPVPSVMPPTAPWTTSSTSATVSSTSSTPDELSVASSTVRESFTDVVTDFGRDYREVAGPLLSSGQTIVRLTRDVSSDGEWWHGAYSQEGGQGVVYDEAGPTTSTDRDAHLSLGFADTLAGQSVASSTVAWSPDGRSLSGTVRDTNGHELPLELLPAQLEGSARIRAAHVHASWEDSKFGTCDYSVTYPQIEATADISPAIADQVNTALRVEAMSTTSTDMRAVAETYLAGCEEDVTSTAAEDAGQMPLDGEHENVLDSFAVTLNQDHLLSVVFTVEEYNAGAAHPNEGQSALTFDLTTGQALTLQNIVQANQLRAFMQQEKKQLLATRGDGVFDENAKEFHRFIADHSATSTDGQLATFGSFNRFYLTPFALITFYDPYEVSAYAYGELETMLPYTSWSKVRLVPSPLDRILVHP